MNNLAQNVDFINPGSRLARALAIAAQGLPIFPVHEMAGPGACSCALGTGCPQKQQGKHPRLPNGHKGASLDPNQIRLWWTDWPQANVAMAVPDGLIVVDVDPRNGGLVSLDTIESDPARGLPTTRTVVTGGGGAHVYYRAPAGLSFPKNLDGLGHRGIDLKGLGGYVLTPPSNHASGGSYTGAFNEPITHAPPWLVALGRPRGEARERAARNRAGTTSAHIDHGAVAALLAPYFLAGIRHNFMRELGGYLMNKGATADDAIEIANQLPTPEDGNIEGREEAATWAWGGADKPSGYSGLLALGVPAELLAQLERLVSLHAQMVAQVRVLPMVFDVAANDGQRSAFPVTTEQLNAGVLARTVDATTIAGVASLLSQHPDWAGVLAYDEFACRVLAAREPPMREQDKPSESCVGPWTDAHTARARAWITERCGDEPGKDATDSAVEMVARANTIHPPRAYLSALQWDGAARLDTLLERYFGAAPSAYMSLVGAKFMISAVARAFKPGCKVDTMLILEGDQGTFKSTAIQTLASSDWFADTALDFGNKDAAQCLQGKWLYEIGELNSFSRAEVNQIKAFISSQSDNLRPSYGRRNVDFPRQCIFVGTTNAENYLTDTTGNRRYWPVKCGRVDVSALRADRDQLWAEAVSRFHSGERWWLHGGEERLAAAEQAERESEDPWEAPLLAWLAGARPPTAPFGVGEALRMCGLLASDQKPTDAQRMGRLLAKLGYRAKSKRDPADWKTWMRVYEKKD